MDEYGKDALIRALQKLIISQESEISFKTLEISNLKAHIERLEAQLKEKKENKN